MKKINGKMKEFVSLAELKMLDLKQKLQNKLSENCGADGSTERGAWIIAVLVIGGVVITLINKFAPEFGDMITAKIKEFFNFIKVS